MRVLVLIHEFPPIGGGGGKVAEDICAGLAGRGYDIRVLTARLGDLPSLEQRDGYQVIRLRSWRRYSFKADLRAMFGFIFSGFWKCIEMARTWRPDLIHVHFAVPAGVLAYVIARLWCIPYVMTVHLGDIPGGVPSKTSTWFRWIFPFTPPIWRSAAKIVSVSHYGRELARQSYPLEMDVIPNGVNLRQLYPGEFVQKTTPQVVFVGRFVDVKNPVQVVKTLSEVKDLPWQCVMIGDGPLRPAVEEEITQRGLGGRFSLTGWLSPEEVITFMRESDILFMPSLAEGLPVVGVQALALGLALVVSQVGGFGDLIRSNENGFLIAPEDLTGFHNALRQLLSDPNKLLSSRRASRALAARFDLQQIVASYDALYKYVVNQS